MPRANFKLNSELLELLYEYAVTDMTADEFTERLDEMSYYQSDIRSTVNDYYAGIA